LAESYDVRQVREFLLKQEFNEVISVEPTIRYFIKEQKIVKLLISREGHSKATIDRLQMELICENIKFPFQMFDSWYIKAKKHKV
jgi:hypothetical protein